VVGDDTLCLKTGMGSSGARELFKMWCQNATRGMRCIMTFRFTTDHIIYDGFPIL
jgi:hypothetical protein